MTDTTPDTSPGDELRQAIVKCFYDEQIDTDEDEWEPREENIEYFDTSAVIDRLNRLMLTREREALVGLSKKSSKTDMVLREGKWVPYYMVPVEVIDEAVSAIDAQLNKEEK